MGQNLFTYIRSIFGSSRRRNGIELPVSAERSEGRRTCVSVPVAAFVAGRGCSWLMLQPSVFLFTQHRLGVYILRKLNDSLQFEWFPWPNNLSIVVPSNQLIFLEKTWPNASKAMLNMELTRTQKPWFSVIVRNSNSFMALELLLGFNECRFSHL